jgi:hypothetical protein
MAASLTLSEFSLTESRVFNLSVELRVNSSAGVSEEASRLWAASVPCTARRAL